MVLKKPNLVCLSGAGISAESGLGTFRGNNGLWENYALSDVATPEAWNRNPKLVLDFYNQRRIQIRKAVPNHAHIVLAQLEAKLNVDIITQNIDDLHEKAGSTSVLHLHGEILKAQSTLDPSLIYTWNKDELNLNDRCELGSQLRPFVVWFGENVPAIAVAENIIKNADVFLVIGTALQVYPAANLIYNLSPKTACFVIDPDADKINIPPYFKLIKANATLGINQFIELLST